MGSRRKDAIAAALPAPFTGILVADGYAGYQHLLSRLAGIQQCCQHVIRRCRAVAKLGPGTLQDNGPERRHHGPRRRPPGSWEAARARDAAALDPLGVAGLVNATTQPSTTGSSTTGTATGHEETTPGTPSGAG